MLNVAIIGFGGIASAAHLKSYNSLEEKGVVKLVAVCDIRPEQFTAKAEINIGAADAVLGADVHTYTDWKEMLENEKIDMVDICLPTFLHDEIAIPVLKMGYHVMCEKPMAMSYERAQNMLAAAKEAGKKLMIGLCLRFENHYLHLKEIVEKGTYGKVLHATFHRLSGPPMWAWENWYMNYERSHGCINDMHIHDLDMVRFVFGDPKSVSCRTADVYSKKDLAESTLVYDDFSVLAVGDWSREGTDFVSDFTIAFEKATVYYNCREGVKIYPRYQAQNGTEYVQADIQGNDPYAAEIEYFVNSIINDTENTRNAPEESATTVRLVNALIESSDNNGKVIEF